MSGGAPALALPRSVPLAGAAAAAAVLSGAVVAYASPSRRELTGECVIVCEAICREGKAMDSPTCAFSLPGGAAVDVIESADVSDPRGQLRRRLCVKSGSDTGWLSEVAGQGIRLITKATPPSSTPTATIHMYTTQRCPWCTRAKELLAAKGWAAPLVEELDPMTHADEFRVMQQKTGKNTVPQIFVVWNTPGEEPQYVGGYDVLAEWDRSGRLDEVLQQAGGALPGGAGRSRGWFGG